ncbi:MAG TPA: Hsp20/alpha crystallin family protein, partial [Acholeplasma sp.]|nr:Hsp20/alpha crystallin family protein [Acholeplasma sp.]
MEDLSAKYEDGIISIEVPKEKKEETKYLEIK